MTYSCHVRVAVVIACRLQPNRSSGHSHRQEAIVQSEAESRATQRDEQVGPAQRHAESQPSAAPAASGDRDWTGGMHDSARHGGGAHEGEIKAFLAANAMYNPARLCVPCMRSTASALQLVAAAFSTAHGEGSSSEPGPETMSLRCCLKQHVHNFTLATLHVSRTHFLTLLGNT